MPYGFHSVYYNRQPFREHASVPIYTGSSRVGVGKTGMFRLEAIESVPLHPDGQL